MNYKKFYNKMKTYLEVNQDIMPMYVLGDSGIGKTEIIKQICKELNKDLFIIQIGSKTLEYFLGLPQERTINYQSQSYAAAEWSLPEIIAKCYTTNKEAVIFVDDFHLARGEERKVMFEMLTDKAMHGHQFPEGTKIILAGNPATSDYGNTDGEIPVPIRRRLFIIKLEPDLDTWIRVSLERGINPIITSFLKFRPDFFLENAAQLVTEDDEIGQSACPRAWWGLSDYVKCGLANLSDFEDLEGFVGKRAAAELKAFYDVYLKFEAELPQWKNLQNVSEKYAFVAYMMIKNNEQMIMKYLPNIIKDDKLFVVLLLTHAAQQSGWKLLDKIDARLIYKIIHEPSKITELDIQELENTLKI